MTTTELRPDKEHHILRLLDDMDFGIDRAQALSSFSERCQLNTRTFDRYWQEAKKRYIAAAKIEHELMQIVKHEHLAKLEISKIMDKFERMEILTQIARGEIPLKKPMVVDGDIEEVEIVPAWMDRKAAIAELNKMDGEYAPVKKETKHSGEMLVKQDLSHLTTAELLERVNAVKLINEQA